MATYTRKVNIVTEVVDGTDRNIEFGASEVSGAIAKVAAPNTTAAALGLDTFHSHVEVTVGDASTDITFLAPFTGKIVDGFYIKTAAGGAADALAVSLGGTDILVFDLNAADKIKVNPTVDIDHAANTFVAGDTITVNPTKAGGNPSGVLFITLKRTA